ncbi:SDR family oxidoreductase [Oleomonas cavernae]|uniref:SDR family oxidoreductase n=1 Tax=Oleomonas cavernae TaxID=2320859 RepID=A0A418WC50_9PROT|nr:SDR family oxidoreductase [Oleomonas cavernae]RJF87595.1 SDR family oxidoreductase [Oleomonas cavernae]
MPAYSFHGQTVVVTGGSRGIGRGIAEGFIAAGAQVVILADDPATPAIAAGMGARGMVCDITDGQSVKAAVAAVPVIDVLINNAGLELFTPIGDPDPAMEARFRRIIEINVIGTYLMTRAALARMPDGGRIVFTASIWGKTAVGGFSAYCASKHANIGFMRSLAHELAPRRIAVNAVCPGWVKTEASLRSIRDEAASLGITPEAHAQTMLGGQVFGGMMEPADMAEAYLFLASREAARNITGQTLHVDRGEVMD